MIVDDFRSLIRESYSTRRREQPSLTLTKFASELGMSPQKLNSVLHHGAGLSTSAARKVAAGLKLQREKADYFVDLVDSSHHRSASEREQALQRVTQFKAREGMDALEVGDFAPIAKWESAAAYVLVETDGFRPDVEWAAKRLGLPVEQTQRIYDELFALGFLRVEDDRWVGDSFTFNVEANESVQPLRDYYSQLSQKAVEFLERNPSDKRHFASAVLSVSVDDLDFIRGEIEGFRKSLVAKLEARTSAKRDRVLALNLNCFPLDRSPL